MSKITVIQLLNKIANGEEIPKKIKYKNFEYIYSLEISWYRRIDDIGSYDEWFINVNRLNDEVEIIEDKEDINIQDIEEVEVIATLKPVSEHISRKENLRRIHEIEVNNFHKIYEIIMQQNKLVQAVKYLEKTKEDK